MRFNKIHRGQVMHRMQAESVVELLRMAETISIIPAGASTPKYHTTYPRWRAIVYGDASSR